MSSELNGNLRGLAPSELKALKKLATRRLGADEIVSLDLARELFGLASQLRRRIGLLISREGSVEEVCVGTKDILYLPDLGRYRLGAGRLRRLRLVFADLSNAETMTIPGDIYTDLEKLRLDMVVGVKVLRSRVAIAYAHLVPAAQSEERAVRTDVVADLGKTQPDFAGLMEDLERELQAERSFQVRTGLMRALLVGVHPRSFASAQASMDELAELARTAGVEVVDRVLQRKEPDPQTLLGKGKVEEVVLRCLRTGTEMIIFDNDLKPAQWRAITNATELKVLDRSMLILDIFAQRAQSSEGRLQVELAQLKYNLPRLVEKDAGLSRLTGGIGGRGPGETKLEIGRRRIRDRITDLERKIDELSAQRRLRRQKREQSEVPLVSILGYTNVGKSTLFNALSGASVLSENKLFATLDPAQRRVALGVAGAVGSGDAAGYAPAQEIVLSDTVGFIRRLPETLRNAFRATLEELYSAALLVHVVDGADPELHSRKEAVERILGEMNLQASPVLMVVNKIDLLPAGQGERIAHDLGGVAVSARTGEGLRALKARVAYELLQQTSYQ
jgi:GTP-binding protein HflX